MKLEFFRQIFQKYSNVTFHENPSSDTETDRRTDMTQLIVAFRNFANATTKRISYYLLLEATDDICPMT
jgi:hypothetical protein